VEVGRHEVGIGDALTWSQSGPRGFIDRNGKLVITAQYAEAAPFSGGLAVVCTGGVMKPNPILNNREVLADRRYAYIDSAGRIVIPGPYAMAAPFREGLAAVTLEEAVGRERAGYIDRTGSLVIPPRFLSAYSFHGGIATVDRRGRRHRGHSSIIDRTGRVILETAQRLLTNFSEGLAVFWTGDAAGYMNLAGEVVIEPQFDNCASFHNGLAAVQRGDWYALIDTKGKVVWGPTTEDTIESTLEPDWT
jgi:hypothetical protein